MGPMQCYPLHLLLFTAFILHFEQVCCTRIHSIWHRPLAKNTPDSKKCIDHEVIGIGDSDEVHKECVSFPFTIGPVEIMPLSKPYDHNGLWDVKFLQLHHKQHAKIPYGSREM